MQKPLENCVDYGIIPNLLKEWLKTNWKLRNSILIVYLQKEINKKKTPYPNRTKHITKSSNTKKSVKKFKPKKIKNKKKQN